VHLYAHLDGGFVREVGLDAVYDVLGAMDEVLPGEAKNMPPVTVRSGEIS